MTSHDTRNSNGRRETANLAGGGAWSQSAELELASLVLTSFVQDTFYRDAAVATARLQELVRLVDPAFVARLALLARRQFHLRSISHVLAATLAEVVKGERWTRPVYRDLVVRADDITGILAAREVSYGLRPLPNSLKRGLGDALRLQTEYALAKYARGTRRVRMVDAVNLCRPLETPAIRSLMTGTLASPDTWEAALTDAGRRAEHHGDADALKAAEWERLVVEDRLGYMALLRNLRNIAAHCSPEAQALVAARIADPDRVRASRQLPFRFATALRALRDGRAALVEGPLGRAVAAALETAVDNVPAFPGRTLVAVDTSGSMLGGWHWGERRAPIETATVFAAALAKKSDADVLLFDTEVQSLVVDRARPVAAIEQDIMSRVTGGGTDFHLVFRHARERYERIVILSDMQAWVPRYGLSACGTWEKDFWDTVEGMEFADAGPDDVSQGEDEQSGAVTRVDDLYDRYDVYLARHDTEVPAWWHEMTRERVVPAAARVPRVPLGRVARTGTVDDAYEAYRRRTGADPLVFCLDLQGYGTTPFVDGRVVQLAGLSEKVFDFMATFEHGAEAMVEAVRAVELPSL